MNRGRGGSGAEVSVNPSTSLFVKCHTLIENDLIFRK